MQTSRQDLPTNLIIYCPKLLDGRDVPTQLISACISIAGSSYEKISNLLEVKPASVRNALYRKTPSYEREIAKAIGVHPNQIWPTRYPMEKNIENESNEK